MEGLPGSSAVLNMRGHGDPVLCRRSHEGSLTVDPPGLRRRDVRDLIATNKQSHGVQGVERVHIQPQCGCSNHRLLCGWLGAGSGAGGSQLLGKSLLRFLLDIHLSSFCQPPTLSIAEQ